MSLALHARDVQLDEFEAEDRTRQIFPVPPDRDPIWDRGAWYVDAVWSEPLPAAGDPLWRLGVSVAFAVWRYVAEQEVLACIRS
jgi:hypothetical protein